MISGALYDGVVIKLLSVVSGSAAINSSLSRISCLSSATLVLVITRQVLVSLHIKTIAL